MGSGENLPWQNVAPMGPHWHKRLRCNTNQLEELVTRLLSRLRLGRGKRLPGEPRGRKEEKLRGPAARALMQAAPVLSVRPLKRKPTKMPIGVATAMVSTCEQR